MPTSPDGILTATFDPARAAVLLSVDGGMWPGPVVSLTITRDGQPVRGLTDRRVLGGTLIGFYDHELPELDVDVVYVVVGKADPASTPSDTTYRATVTVSTTGAAWGLWLKAPGRPELTMCLPLKSVNGRTVEDQGGEYQVHGGGAVAESSGVQAERLQIVVDTLTPGEAGALRNLYQQAAGRTFLVQTAQPEEFPSGWYRVGSLATENLAQTRSDAYARRRHTLALTRVDAPAGEGLAFAGATYEAARQTGVTYGGLRGKTYAQIARGE